MAKFSQYRELREVRAFLEEMNKNCARLNLKSSFFDSPHGLMNTNSKSSALDMAKLAALCMEDPRFTRVVTTKTFVVKRSENKKRQQSGPATANQRTYRWENTHRLLLEDRPGVSGIKTGITNSAGPCLATAIEVESNRLIVVLLSCKSMDARWFETLKLAKWAGKRMARIRTFTAE